MSDTLIILAAVIICVGIYISYREKVERDIKRQNLIKYRRGK